MSQQTMIKPQQIEALPLLDANQKQQYKAGLSGLWAQFESAPEGSPQKAEARQKIITASHRIMAQISQKSRPANGQPRPQNGQNAGNNNAPNMQMSQSQNPQFAQQRPPQQQQPPQPQQNPQQQQQQQQSDPDSAIKEMLTGEINRVVVAPPDNVTNQAQFELYKQNFKTSLGSFRFKAEKAKQNEGIIQRQMQQMQQMGQQPTDEMQEKLAAYRNAYQTFNQQAQNMMTSNERNLQAAQARKNQNQNQTRPDQPPRPATQPGNVNQQDTASPAQPQGQGQPARPMPQPTPIQQPQRPGQGAQSFNQQYPNAPNSAAPQTVNQAQRPHALSQQGAIAKAQEHNNQQSSASQPQSAVQGGMPFNQPPPQNTPTSAVPQSGAQLNSKFPIPKNLNLGPQTQTPVNGASARPTIMNHGMMSAPGIQKVPQFTLEGEGDHVMSSRKLNEIVRQVTGTADPADGLAPEVEEAVLSMTDNFVDDVITRACQLAKLRQGSTLDIRDVQLVLERNYGLRIPGYSLDETRTVRKFNPSPNWVAKVQSVQASKLTKGE